MAIVALSDFTDRYEGSLTAAEQSRVTALIDDASALVVQAVDDSTVTDTWDPDAAPAAVVPVVYNMVRRAFINPDQVESETIGSYTWRGRAPGIFMTKDEARSVRKAAGKLGVGTAQLEGYMRTDRRVHDDWLEGAL